jgi:hypothetical protein
VQVIERAKAVWQGISSRKQLHDKISFVAGDFFNAGAPPEPSRQVVLLPHVDIGV